MRDITSLFIVILGLLAAGCGGGQQGQDSTSRIRVDGSSTVFPITQAVVEEYMQSQQGVRVSASISGTGGGFEKFFRGETAINDASRPITESEIQLAEQNNIGFIELPVAYDGLAVVAHPDNDWATCLTTEELEMIWEPNSSVENWSDVRSEWPDEPISLYGPGTASGTYDYFTEAIVGESGASRTDFSASEDDNVLVQGVSGDDYSLGFFGLAYYENNQDQLKIIAVDDGNPDNGEGCIEPSQETIENGTYQPLARPLFIYVSANQAENSALSDFVNYYLENVGSVVTDVGYIPLSDEAYKLARNRFESRVTGTMLGEGMDPVGIDVEEMLRSAQSSSGQQPASE